MQRFTRIFFCWMGAFTLIAPTSVNAESNTVLELTCNLVSTQASLHEPVWMTIAIKNDSSGVAKVDLGQDRKAAIGLSIVEPDGSTVTARLPRRGGLHGIGLVNIASKGTYTQRLVLNEWYPFTKIGKYQITVRLAPFPEQQVSLEILPRDSARITKTCEELITTIKTEYAEMFDAALALSYINDPIAIPYLQDAAQAHSGVAATIAMAGLARIDGDSGAKALISLSSGNQRAQIRAVARTHLWQIMQDSKDLALKEEIKQALEKQ